MQAIAPICLLLILALTGCDKMQADGVSGGSENVATQRDSPLPLSPGIQVSLLVSGGIAGLSDVIQISEDWQLVVLGKGASWVRRLDAGEQQAARKIMQGFGRLDESSDDGEDVADGMSSQLVVRGFGEGQGTTEDGGKLTEFLLAVKAIGQ